MVKKKGKEAGNVDFLRIVNDLYAFPAFHFPAVYVFFGRESLLQLAKACPCPGHAFDPGENFLQPVVILLHRQVQFFHECSLICMISSLTLDLAKGDVHRGHPPFRRSVSL